ncbi:MAG: restriction endonuclease [Candidatus Oleimicrobiaceae bacterium]
MPIPDYQSLMMPLLKLAESGQEHAFHPTVERLADDFRLTQAEREELLPSGTQRVFDNRVSWALTYLVKAGLMERPRRGGFRITERGRQVLRHPPAELNVKYLERFAEFRAFRERETVPKTMARGKETEEARTPAEVLEDAHRRLREELASELLEQVKRGSPGFFERLVVDLLVRMGYGGTRADAGKAVGRTGDGGVDGIINEDRLGLDVVYIQAKRWDQPVGRPEIQKFVGALQGHKAKKGVFITTGSFTRDAQEYAEHIDMRIVLVDGRQLAELMIDCNLGVTTVASYETKRIDADYFEHE